MKLALSLTQRFIKHQQGGVLMLTGMVILVSIAAMGSGIDFGRQQLTRLKLQQASDAAALAAASLGPDASEQSIKDTAHRYFAMNYPTSYLGIKRPEIQITTGDSIGVRANASVSSLFISVVGVDTLDANASTVVKADSGHSREVYHDIAVFIDTSASMAGPIDGSPELMLEASPSIKQRRQSSIFACNGLPVEGMSLSDVLNTNEVLGPDGRLRKDATIGQTFCNNLPSEGSPTLQKWEGYAHNGTNKLNAVRYAVASFGLNVIAGNTPDSQGRLYHDDQNFFEVAGFSSVTADMTLEGLEGWSLSMSHQMGGIVQQNEVPSVRKLGYRVTQNPFFDDLLTMRAIGWSVDPNSFFSKVRTKYQATFPHRHRRTLIIVTDGIDSCAGNITRPWAKSIEGFRLANTLPNDIPALNDYDCKKGWITAAATPNGNFYDTVNTSNPKFAIQQARTEMAKSGIDVHVILVGEDPLSATASEKFWKQFVTTDSNGQPNLHHAPNAEKLNEVFDQMMKKNRRIRIVE